MSFTWRRENLFSFKAVLQMAAFAAVSTAFASAAFSQTQTCADVFAETQDAQTILVIDSGRSLAYVISRLSGEIQRTIDLDDVRVLTLRPVEVIEFAQITFARETTEPATFTPRSPRKTWQENRKLLERDIQSRLRNLRGRR